jgi:hypothetical protein
MRLLLQPRILSTASLAAALSALACYPRLVLWLQRPTPVWYLEAVIFFCCIVLWGFVFAWHQPYTGRPALVLRPEPAPLAVATVGGIALALIWHGWLDPVLRPQLPEEYPPDWGHWLASVAFLLAFNQLFSIFAPVDWLMRLTQNRWVTAGLAGLMAAALFFYKTQKLAVSVPPSLLAVMLLCRLLAGLLVVWFYLRGGLPLVWWWGLLLESRLVPDFLK